MKNEQEAVLTLMKTMKVVSKTRDYIQTRHYMQPSIYYVCLIMSLCRCMSLARLNPMEGLYVMVKKHVRIKQILTCLKQQFSISYPLQHVQLYSIIIVSTTEVHFIKTKDSFYTVEKQ